EAHMLNGVLVLVKPDMLLVVMERAGVWVVVETRGRETGGQREGMTRELIREACERERKADGPELERPKLGGWNASFRLGCCWSTVVLTGWSIVGPERER
ncbi:hypothetical protein Tco_0096071, partial [Tanacetum coccineum]